MLEGNRVFTFNHFFLHLFTTSKESLLFKLQLRVHNDSSLISCVPQNGQSVGIYETGYTKIQLIAYKRFLECTLIQWRLSNYPLSTQETEGTFIKKSPVAYTPLS